MYTEMMTWRFIFCGCLVFLISINFSYVHGDDTIVNTMYGGNPAAVLYNFGAPSGPGDALPLLGTQGIMGIMPINAVLTSTNSESTLVSNIHNLLDSINTRVTNYTTIYNTLASAEDPNATGITGYRVYLQLLQIVVKNLNVTNNFLIYLKGQIATAQSSADTIIGATQNYLSYLVNSTDNILAIDQLIEQGGWTDSLGGKTNAIFSMIPGLSRNIIASAIAICSKTSSNDYGGEMQMISSLTDLDSFIEKLHYLFDITYKISIAADDNSDIYDIQLGNLFDLLALIKASYANLIVKDQAKIYAMNSDFLSVFANVFPLKFGKENFNIVNGVIQQVKTTGEVIAFDFLNPYVSALNTHHFDSIIANMNISLTAYINSIRANVKILKGQMAQLFYNNANFTHVDATWACVQKSDILDTSVVSLVNAAFAEIFLALTVNYFPFLDPYSKAIVDDFQVVLISVYNGMKKQTTKTNFFNYFKTVIVGMEPVVPTYPYEDAFASTISDVSVSDRAGVNGAFADFSQAYANIVQGCSASARF